MASGSGRKEVPLVVRGLVVAALFLIPIRILAHGYLPLDDALRHAAKVVSGRSWAEILVLRPDVTVDSHPGWHAVLGVVQRATDWEPHPLVLFSVVALFLVFSLGPAFLLRRPEAWILTLLVLAVTDAAVLSRVFMGRPFLVSGGALVVICLVWPRLGEVRVMAAVALLLAAATWIHASWYLFVLPVLALLIAGERRASMRLTLCLAVGVAVGAALTGHPLAFLRQTLFHPLWAFGGFEDQSTLAIEFRAHQGSALFVLAVLLALVWRGRAAAVGSPVLILAGLGWGLGFLAKRFWADWGTPAALVWLSLELQDSLEAGVGRLSWRRLGAAAAAVLAGFLSLTSDLGGRWSTRDRTFLPLFNPEAAPWLPEPGGILYSDDMRLFYQLFYHQPQAPWRYVVGFEPGLMPKHDLAVYRDILRARTTKAFAPWVEEMRPEDRLIILSVGESPPPIGGLQWHYLGGEVWSGRKPRGP